MIDLRREEPQTRRDRLRAIAAEYTEEIYDDRSKEQLAGREPVSRFAVVTSEGSPDSSHSSNGNLVVADTTGELARRIRAEAVEGWVTHGRAWDLDAEWAVEGNLDHDYEVSVRVGETTAWSCDPVPDRAPCVWISAFDYGQDVDVRVCRSEALALREVAVACRLSWAEACRVDDRRLRTAADWQLPADPPEDDGETVELYFAVMEEATPTESYVITRHEVIGAGEEDQ